MKHRTRLSISVLVLFSLTLGTTGTPLAGAKSVVAKGKAHTVSVAPDKTVGITAKPAGETVVVTPTADILEVTTERYVSVSKGKKRFVTTGTTYLCVRAGGCQCAAGESLRLDPPPAQLGPGKVTLKLSGGENVKVAGYAVEELCDKTDRCLLGSWSADLSLYLASLHLKVASLSGTEKYTFTKKAAYADATNYTINAIDQKDPGNGIIKLIVNGNASAPSWLTPQPGKLRLGTTVGNWSIFVDGGPFKGTIPASNVYAPFGPWAGQTGGTYQCDANGTTVQYTPDPSFAAITLTRTSS
jgi:hypothetical protein